MSYSLISKQGQLVTISNDGWYFILGMAGKGGWKPMGTVLYKQEEYSSDLDTRRFENGISINILHTEGDAALAVDLATRSEELDPEWNGDYTAYAGQIITAQDAANMAAALRNDEEITNDPLIPESNIRIIQKLISILESGEVMIV